jgi:hypothetical protein
VIKSPGRQGVPDPPGFREEREAVTLLHEDWFARQKEFLASLHARYPFLPWVLRAIRTLDAGHVCPTEQRKRNPTGTGWELGG